MTVFFGYALNPGSSSCHAFAVGSSVPLLAGIASSGGGKSVSPMVHATVITLFHVFYAAAILHCTSQPDPQRRSHPDRFTPTQRIVAQIHAVICGTFRV